MHDLTFYFRTIFFQNPLFFDSSFNQTAKRKKKSIIHLLFLNNSRQWTMHAVQQYSVISNLKSLSTWIPRIPPYSSFESPQALSLEKIIAVAQSCKTNCLQWPSSQDHSEPLHSTCKLLYRVILLDLPEFIQGLKRRSVRKTLEKLMVFSSERSYLAFTTYQNSPYDKI